MISAMVAFVDLARLPGMLLSGAAAGAACLWFGVWWLTRKGGRRLRLVLPPIRLTVIWGAWMLLFQALLRWCTLATPWPLWFVALLGAGGCEVVYALYPPQLPRASRLGRWALPVLRLAVVVLLVLILVQPEKTLERIRREERTLAILLDTSASMRIADRQMQPWRRLRLAEALSLIPPGANPCRSMAGRVRAIRERIAGWVDQLERSSLQPPRRRRDHWTRQGPLLHETLREIAHDVQGLLGNLETLPARDAATGLAGDDIAPVRMLLETRVLPPLSRSADWTAWSEDIPSQAGPIASALASAAEALQQAGAKLEELAIQVDRQRYQQLASAPRQTVDALAERTRLELASQLLLGSSKGSGLVDRLAGEYNLRLYGFDGETQELSPGDLTIRLEPVNDDPTQPDANNSADDPIWRSDLTEALRMAVQQQGEDLGGIVLLSDGRHNVHSRPETPARILGRNSVPVHSVVLGSTVPPADAAVAAVDAPTTVFAGDRVSVEAECKLDGLAGQTVTVQLLDGQDVVDTQEVEVSGDAMRTRVRLADDPQHDGLHWYTVRILPVEQELSGDNNARTEVVAISSDRTRVLLVDSRPRWEFRYLKNLLAYRDPGVRLQYVLLEPDRVASAPDRPVIPASATRPQDQPEATALPASREDWLAFDVILLGDVSTDMLGPAAPEILRQFVTRRGGTLVILSGPSHMPTTLRGSVLEQLLPVTLPMEPPTSPPQPFHIALTPEGADHEILRQDGRPGRNQAIWESFPPIRLRRQGLSVKPGASVLAFAMPIPPPALFTSSSGPSPEEETRLRRRQDFQRTHPLVCVQRFPPGRVLLLAFDRTWRLRYRRGDTCHLRFWGQVLRWATADRLAAGSETIRLGTGRMRYPSGMDVTVRARLMDASYAPISSEDVSVEVFRAGEPTPVLRQPLQQDEALAGSYDASLGSLPAGAYRVELRAPAVDAILASQGVETVSAGFSVAPAAAETEMVELTSDRDLLGRIATLTSGRLFDPADAGDVLQYLRPPVETIRETRDVRLWDSWVMLAGVALLATGEWVLRRKESLP